jgi:LPXTG-motif cell wall-anchored protein
MTSKVIRLLAATAAVGVVTVGGASSAAAEDYDTVPAESYPIPTDPVTHPPMEPKPLPATGSDSTAVWLKIGGGTLLAGGILVAATSRRRSETSEATS